MPYINTRNFIRCEFKDLKDVKDDKDDNLVIYYSKKDSENVSPEALYSAAEELIKGDEADKLRAKVLFEEIIDSSPKTEIGNKATFELAKLYLTNSKNFEKDNPLAKGMVLLEDLIKVQDLDKEILKLTLKLINTIIEQKNVDSTNLSKAYHLKTLILKLKNELNDDLLISIYKSYILGDIASKDLIYRENVKLLNSLDSDWVEKCKSLAANDLEKIAEKKIDFQRVISSGKSSKRYPNKL